MTGIIPSILSYFQSSSTISSNKNADIDSDSLFHWNEMYKLVRQQYYNQQQEEDVMSIIDENAIHNLSYVNEGNDFSTTKHLSRLLLQEHERSLETATASEIVTKSTMETMFERYSDLVLGIAFLVTSYIAAKRMYVNARQLSLATSSSATTAGTATGTTTTTNGGGGNNNGGNVRTQGSSTASIGSSSNSNSSSGGGGAETTVVTAFYSLILVTSILRAIWFLLPLLLTVVLTETTTSTSTSTASTTMTVVSNGIQMIQSTPIAVYAFDSNSSPDWIIYSVSELIVTAGSLTLFSIFILILVYWADILKKYYNPGSRRSLPMSTFIGLVCTLIGIELINLVFFLFKFYSTEGMILINSIVLAIVSIICVCEITIFSKKFQNVLKTLGAINQVSTDNQIRRIVWITVTGNLFFFTRALLETIFATMLIVYYIQNGTINKTFTHTWWDIYTIIKYTSEITILALMLHILQSRFTSNNNNNGSAAGANTARGSTQQQPSQSNKLGYTKVPDVSVNV